MRRTAIIALSALTFITGFSHAAQPAAAAPEHHHRHDAADAQASALPRPGPIAVPLEIGELETGRLVGYLHDQAIRDIVAYVAASDAAEAAQRAAETARAATTTIPVPDTPRTGSGAHSDAWWRGVSVCEQGGRNDGYFGYFSIMDGSAGGLDWSTQVAMANGIIGRYGDGAWAASCVAAGYAASPSG